MKIKSDNVPELRAKKLVTQLKKINADLKQEIEERKQIEKELKNSEERLKILFDFAPDAYYLNDLTGTFIDGNKAAEEMIGYKRKELIGKNYLKIKLLPAGQIPKAAMLLARNVMGKPTGPDEFILNQKDGRRVEVEIRTFPVKIKGKTSVLGIARDITERKIAEEKLRQSEKKYRQIVENTFDVTCTMDRDGNFIEVNQAFLRRSGYERDEIIGHSFTNILHPGDKALAFEACEKGLKGEVVEFEIRTVMKDGTCGWFFFVNHPLKAKDGTVKGIHTIAKEVTDLKQVEHQLRKANKKLKSTQTQLIQSAKLSSIGELASGVAHELNQPLMVIRGNTQFIERILRKRDLETDELMKLIELLGRNTKRMMNIINHLRFFSRQSGSAIQEVDVNKIIEDTFLMVGEQLYLQNIEVKKEFAHSLPRVQGDVNQLEQVFLNLLTNARDAIEDCRIEKACPSGPVDQADRTGAEYKGVLEIITRVRKPVSDLKENENYNQQSKGFVEILIKDNGGGISEKNLDKIFDPFFTTKKVGKGTGLGLSISYGIIQDHKGEVEVANTGPEGTTFRIKLPALHI